MHDKKKFPSLAGISMDMGTLLVSSVVRGYHVYQALWETFLGEELVVLHEVHNDDHRTIAVYRILEASHVIVGHLPQENIKSYTHHFARYKGKIKGTVTAM